MCIGQSTNNRLPNFCQLRYWRRTGSYYPLCNRIHLLLQTLNFHYSRFYILTITHIMECNVDGIAWFVIECLIQNELYKKTSYVTQWESCIVTCLTLSWMFCELYSECMVCLLYTSMCIRDRYCVYRFVYISKKVMQDGQV